MLGRFGLGGQVWPYMHNSNQKSSNCNKEVAPKTCHFKQTICRLQKILIFTQLFPFSSLNLWFTHVLSRKCRKWHFRVLVGSFSLKSRMVGRLDNSGAGQRRCHTSVGLSTLAHLRSCQALPLLISPLTLLHFSRGDEDIGTFGFD